MIDVKSYFFFIEMQVIDSDRYGVKCLSAMLVWEQKMKKKTNDLFKKKNKTKNNRTKEELNTTGTK